MITKEQKKEMSRIIRERLSAGEEKREINQFLQTEFEPNSISTHLLAQWATQADKDKYRKLNQALLISLIVLTVFKMITTGVSFWSRTPWLTPAAFFPLMNYLIIYLVSKGNGLGYSLSVLFYASVIFKLNDGDLSIIRIAIYLLALVTAILAEILRRRLFPNSTFFMQPRKDGDGNYIL
jgi:membrane-associated HD superfamily phosphohydrolase